MSSSKTVKLKDYFTAPEWAIFAVVVILGIALRFLCLDARPIHHDESLYGMYSYYYYNDPVGKFYKYNPLLHGPFLYNFYPWVFNMLGTSNWALRAPMALIGSCFLFIPLLFRRHLRPAFMLLLTVGISLSPVAIYWSRFVTHDPFVILTLLLMLISLELSRPAWKSFWMLFLIMFHLAIKMNFYVTLSLVIGFLFYEVIVARTFKGSYLEASYRDLRKHSLFALGGLVVGAILFCFLYSAGFQYSEGILDGLYRKSFPYWIGQHKIERLTGPFSYHFFSLSWYELPLMLLMFTQVVLFYLRAPKLYFRAGIISLGISILTYFIFRRDPLTEMPFFHFFKLKIPVDILTSTLIFFHSFISTAYYLRNKDRVLAFWNYFFFASFFTYSYLGEKVPWLSFYIFVPGVVFIVLAFQDFFKNSSSPIESYPLSKLLLPGIVILGVASILCVFEDGTRENIGLLTVYALLTAFYIFNHYTKKFVSLNLFLVSLVALGIWNSRIAIITNFSNINNDTEFIRQVHTTEEMHEIVNSIKQRSWIPVATDRLVRVQALDLTVWPLLWYFKDYPQFGFHASPEADMAQVDFIFQELSSVATFDGLTKSHFRQKIPFRSWWTPDYSSMSLKRYFRYAFFHVPWNVPGHLDVAMQVKRTPETVINEVKEVKEVVVPKKKSIPGK